MIEKPLTLVSLNIKGLRGNLPKLKEIKAWLASLSTPPPPPQSFSFKSTTLGRKESRIPPKELSFGKAAHSGTKESPWVARKGLVQAQQFWSTGRPPLSSKNTVS
jgi:hypothetical protein